VWELTNANRGNKFVDEEAIDLLNRVKGVLSPSKVIDEAIRKNYSFQGEILRLPFWLEDLESQPDGSNGSDFIFLGRRDPDKGLEDLIRAGSSLLEEFPTLDVLVAGYGDPSYYEKVARSLGAATAFRFHTFSERRDLLGALVGSRCLVLPSYHEGYPLVLLEAARAGVPIIASRVGSIPSMFENCPGCLITEPRDIGGLKSAMKALLLESEEAHHSRSRILSSHYVSNLSQESAIAFLRDVVMKCTYQNAIRQPN
jgi:glycosyltransferase involved in cell wall biosynthesis